MKVFDVAELSKEKVAPLSQYRGFEGVVTAMAFANNSPNIAFCVRGRAVHRLFIADAETLQLRKLEEFDHEKPWVKYDEESRMMLHTDAAPGITSLAFSPDDKVLVAHGHYSGTLHKFSQWNLQWDDSGRLASAKKSSKELENDDGPLIQESGSQSIWFVRSPSRRQAPEAADAKYPRLSESSQYRVLVRVQDGFMAVNLNSNREEQKIDFLTTHHKVPLYSISNDGRWLIMGDDSGLAYIWDIVEGDRYSVTMDPDTEATLRDPEQRLKNIRERPAHTGPIAGVALSEPDAGRDYPAFAATFGEENKIKVWELYPILDPQNGLRSRNVARYPVVSRSVSP
jgi:WD40 repeat protein